MTVLVTGGAGYIGSHMVHALVDAGERVVVLDNLTTGFDWAVAKGAPLVVGDVGDQPRVAALIAEHRVDAIIHFAASIVVPDSVRDPLGYYRNNTVNSRALIETAVEGGVRHFIFSSTAAVYGNPERVPVARRRSHGADVALWLLEADDRDHAARRRHRPRAAPRDPALLQRRGRRSARPHRPVDQRAPPTSSRSRSKPRSACGRKWRSSAPTIRRRTAPASATTSTCPIWCARIRDALAYLRGGGASVTLNCGYGRGFSVLEVIETVKRVSGVDFKVELAGRRAGDPARIVAASDRARAALKWQPHFDDLQTIVAHALAWERKLATRAG